MLVYEQIDVSDGVDISNSKECMFCHYWYYLDKDFTYGPYLCNGCYNIKQKSIDLKNIAIVHIKKSGYRIYLFGRYLGSNENLILTNSALSTVDHRHLNHLTHI